MPAKSVHWGVMWDAPDDSMLLVGIYEYGMGSWEAIKMDTTLGLSNKVRQLLHVSAVKMGCQWLTASQNNDTNLTH